MDLLGYIIGLAMLLGFFVIWYLVSQIRKESVRQTAVLRMMWFNSEPGRSMIVGRLGTLQMSIDDKYKFAEAEIGQELWKCFSAVPIAVGARVRVTKLEGLTLIVEEVKAGSS